MGSANGNGGVPPGFRFHPTDEELLHYYLKKKVSFQKFDMEVIREVDLNKMEPWELQERCRIGSTPQNEWYFFSHKDRKYPTGSRTNRATNAGFWKATGRDKCIRNSYKKIGMRKTLVFYRGRAPHGQKTDWIMHEYRIEDGDDPSSTNVTEQEDGWVVCRVFKKKNLFKVGSEQGGSSINSLDQQLNSSSSTTATQRSNLIHRISDQYMTTRHHNFNLELNKAELALHYPPPTPHHMPLPTPQTQYSLFQPQTQTQTLLLKPISSSSSSYDYGNAPILPGLPPDSPAPVMIKQLMSNPRDCESTGSESLRYQAGCEPGLEVGTGRDEAEGINEWGMLDRLMGHHDQHSSKGVRFDEDTNASSVHPINQLSLRGEMDFWGYGK